MEDNTEVVPSESKEVTGQTFTQGQLEDIVKREKARAADSARQKMEAQHREEMDRLKAEMGNKAPMSGEIDTDSIENKVYDRFLGDLQKHREEAERERLESELKSKADQYHLKMGKGSQLFEDFNETVADFNPADFPSTVFLAAEMENTPELIYELAKHPEKLQQIDYLAKQSPAMAKKQLQRLSDSIKQNLEAKNNNVSAPPPLSRLKSSTVGADSGKMSLKDMKSAPWLRG
jgi:gas vesicle protein